MNIPATAPLGPRRSAVLAWAIFVLAAAGLVLSVISVVSHYRTSATEFCDIGETFNCDIVNRSIYSTIGPVPVAGIGVAGYAALMALAHLARNRQKTLLMLAAAVAGLAFALYLTYIEAYVLVTWCIVCLGSLAMISLITLLSAWQTVRLWRA